MILRCKRKLNVGAIGTTADLSKEYGAWTAWKDPRKRKWDNSITNHEANRLLINKLEKRENERAIYKQQTKDTPTNEKNQQAVDGL